jgi:hypothetical protein
VRGNFSVGDAIGKAAGFDMNEEVEAYIRKQKSPQREICRKLREIITKTYPAIEEKMWMGVPWYEGRYYIVALKDHVNLGCAVQGLSENDLCLFEGKGKTMRHIKLYAIDDINEHEIVKLLKVAEKATCTC